MSSIAPIQSSVTTAAANTALTVSQTQTPSGQGGQPLYLGMDGFSTLAADVLGIRLPGTDGDIAALIAEASLNLEKSVDESRKSRAIAGLSGLSAALSTSGLQKVYDEWQNRRKTLNDAKATLNDVNGQLAPLKSTLDAQNARIDDDRARISNLQKALQDPNLSDSERASLQVQLTAAQSSLADDLAARKTTDVALANLRIAFLGAQIQDLQAQLSRAEPGSSDAAAIQDQIDALTSEKSQAETDLSAFQSGPQDDATLTAFSEVNLAALEKDIADFTKKVSDYQKAYDAQSALLDSTTMTTMTAAASAAAEFTRQQDADTTADAVRDQAIGRAFEGIAAQARAASAAQVKTFKVRNEHDQDIVDSSIEDRVQKAAAALLGLVGDLLSTLSQLSGTQLPAVQIAASASAAGGRNRLEL